MDIDNHRLEDDLNALEHRLSAWRPAAGGALDRDRMLYDAGRAAAETDGHLRAWRMATAALLLVTIGLGGMLAHHAVVARRRNGGAAIWPLETAIAARTAAPEASPPAPSPTSVDTGIEPVSPTSYFVLTARLARDVRDVSSPDLEIEPGPHRPATEPAEILLQPRLLSPRDVQRILDL